MTIGSITPLVSIPAIGPVAPVQPTEPLPKGPFKPAPALRPTIQDTISIDLALLALRAP